MTINRPIDISLIIGKSILIALVWCSCNIREKQAYTSNIMTHSSKTSHAIIAQPPAPEPIRTLSIPQEPEKEYTIQICTMNTPLTDIFFNGNSAIKIIKIGDLYRYVYSRYNSLAAARLDLPKIRRIYPEAFIREIKGQKLGESIDLQIKNN